MRVANGNLWIRFFLACAGLCQALAAQTTAARDTVVLQNGKQLTGRVVRSDADKVVLRIGSVDRTLPRKDVRSVDCIADKHRELMQIWPTVALDDTAALQALAARAEREGLVHEATLWRWYVLLKNPGDLRTHEALGNRQQRGTFLVEIGGQWVPFADADALGQDFSKSWRLRSEHFAIQCAAGLRHALDALLELEGLYWLMHTLVGQELQLLELVEPIPVRHYRDRPQMPSVSNNFRAYFSIGEATLYTCVEDERPFALFHEGTHALLHYQFVRAAKSKGTLPAWLDEGWADYMQGRLVARVPGKATALAGSVQGYHFTVLAEAQQQKRLLGLHRVLNLQSSDFGASTHQATKYAQSWALFRFLFESEDQELRKAFLDYLREATAGRGQASTFRRLFAAHEKVLEQAPWRP
jgi:hypothetical protein